MNEKKLFIEVYHDCNMNCFYCNRREIPFSILNNSNIRKIIYCAKEIFGIEEVIYSGGEPLLLDNLPKLVKEVGKENNKNLLQVIETNGTQKDIIEKVVQNKCSPLRFDITLSASDESMFEQITNQNNLFLSIKKNIEYLVKERIPVNLHFVLIKNLNFKLNTIKKYIDMFEKNDYITIFFEELQCDTKNDLKVQDYFVNESLFLDLAKNLSFESTKNTLCYKYDGKEIIYNKLICMQDQCEHCKLNNNLLVVTADGFLKKCSVYNEIQSEKINNFSREMLLREMQVFKDKYFSDEQEN